MLGGSVPTAARDQGFMNDLADRLIDTVKRRMA
jgi:hypothetical protein